jgi:hypothetical protein
MATAMRVAGNKKGKGGKAMGMTTRMVGEQTATVTKKAMAMTTWEAGKGEGNGKGGKSNGNGKEDGDGKRQ